jgi:hypothetical protein
MAFVVSAAATAASAAAFVAAGGVAAGSAAVTAATVGSVVGGGLAAGAVGAGLGAITAAATGQDVGKGALMGGVGGVVTGGMASGLSAGLGAAATGTGASTAIGAGSGAAGGAASAAAGGEDPLKGAALGGAAGGISGYMKGVDSVGTGETLADVSDAGGSTAKVGASEGIKISPADLPQTALGPDIPIAFEPTPAAMSSGEMTSALNQPITTSAPPMGVGSYGSNTAAINSVNAGPSVTAPTPSTEGLGGYIDKGIKLIKDNPAIAMQLGGAALSLMGGESEQEKKPKTVYPYTPSTYVPPPIQETTIPQYYNPTGGYTGYAEGGAVDGVQSNGQMNPIVARAMQLVQVQQPQASQTPTPQPLAPQGIMSAQQPMMQQPMMQQPMMQQPMGQPMQQPMMQQPMMQQPMSQPMGQPMGGITQPTQTAAGGGMMRDNLGGYSHGGIAGLTRGPGDGVSDSIPAQIGDSGRQPARLADGEFVIPSRIVSELGNGSTEAGAKALQAMVDRIQTRRSKTVGKGKVAVNSRARKELA